MSCTTQTMRTMTTPRKLTITELWRFVGRRNPFAVQMKRGGYIPVRRSLTDDDIRRHLEGEQTLGTYVVREDGLVGYGVIDIDTAPDKVDFAVNLATNMAGLFPEFYRVIEKSGRRGCHLWIFTEGLERPEFVRNLIKTRLGLAGIRKIEIFPKQDKVEYLGNLIKLPCGKHKQGGWSEVVEVLECQKP